MELTRRDAVAALGALGVGTGAVAVSQRDRLRSWGGEERPEPGADTEAVQETLVATADVVYPSAVDGVDEFVETWLEGRLDGGDHEAGLRTTVEEFDETIQAWYEDRFVNLDADVREEALRAAGTDTADEDPDGTLAERVRYYVVNDLLFALYASPTGGELVGIENPQGHPGGTTSYQQGPP